MLKYKRISYENGIIVYEFYPEGDVSAPGIVSFDGEKRNVIKESSKDVKHYYANHAIFGIDTKKESGTVAWC